MRIRDDHQSLTVTRHLLTSRHGVLTSLRGLTLFFMLLLVSACTGKIEDTTEDTMGGSTSIEEDTTPEDTTPEDTTPEDTTPEETTPEETTPEETTPEETTPEETTPVSLDDLDRESIAEAEEEEVSLVAPEPIAILERPRRRMTLDQLDTAIQQVSGGLIWSERRNNQDQNLFESLSSTLGKPDYIQRTSEDLSPSALFMKFLDDAARQVCNKRIEIDLNMIADPREEIDTSISLWGALSPEQTSSEDTVAIEQQLRALVLRFHSRTLPEGESPRLAHWRWLFETASLVDHTPISGWRALCIALITHPDFYSY